MLRKLFVFALFVAAALSAVAAEKWSMKPNGGKK